MSVVAAIGGDKTTLSKYKVELVFLRAMTRVRRGCGMRHDRRGKKVIGQWLDRSRMRKRYSIYPIQTCSHVSVSGPCRQPPLPKPSVGLPNLFLCVSIGRPWEAIQHWEQGLSCTCLTYDSRRMQHMTPFIASNASVPPYCTQNSGSLA